jgi:hypothetical protein
MIFLNQFCIIRIIHFILIILQVDALLKTLELQESAQRKGHFALFNCLVIGHTKYWCAAGLLQSVSCENVLWQSSIGPRHDQAAGYR